MDRYEEAFDPWYRILGMQKSRDPYVESVSRAVDELRNCYDTEQPVLEAERMLRRAAGSGYLPREYRIALNFIYALIRSLQPGGWEDACDYWENGRRGMEILAENRKDYSQSVSQYQQFLKAIPEKPDQRPIVSKTSAYISNKSGHAIVQIPLSSLVPVDDLMEVTAAQVKAIDFIYSLIILIISGSKSTIQSLCAFLRESDNISSLQRDELTQFYDLAQIQPLRVASMHYGSPVVFDLLGIGNILQVIRDIVKDLSWRGKHEKQSAELELQDKRVEIRAKEVALDKASLEVVSQRLKLLKDIYELPLSDDEKFLIASALVPKVNSLTIQRTNLSIRNE